MIGIITAPYSAYWKIMGEDVAADMALVHKDDEGISVSQMEE